MNKSSYVPVAFLVLLLVGVFLFTKISSLSRTMIEKNAVNARFSAALLDSVINLRHELDSLNGTTPGLGEYMTGIQLHIAKLWYAGQASNWKLASFELNELRETIEPAQALHVMKNGVNVSNVLESVKETQLAAVDKAVQSGDAKKFVAAYDQTLLMCNGCHHSVTYDFSHIVRPKGEPVVNQEWKMGREVK